MEPDESISGILEEISFADTMVELEGSVDSRDQKSVDEVRLHSTKMYELIARFEHALEEEAILCV